MGKHSKAYIMGFSQGLGEVVCIQNCIYRSIYLSNPLCILQFYSKLTNVALQLNFCGFQLFILQGTAAKLKMELKNRCYVFMQDQCKRSNFGVYVCNTPTQRNTHNFSPSTNLLKKIKKVKFGPALPSFEHPSLLNTMGGFNDQ